MSGTQLLRASYENTIDRAMIWTLLSSPLPRNLAGKLLNEPGQPERQCIVIRLQSEEQVGHASAVLLDTKLGCFQGLGAWVLSQLAISRVMAVQSRGLVL